MKIVSYCHYMLYGNSPKSCQMATIRQNRDATIRAGWHGQLAARVFPTLADKPPAAPQRPMNGYGFYHL